MGTITLTPSGSEPGTIVTPDRQASVLFRRNAIVPRQGESLVQVRLVPLDPETVAPAPEGARFDSNAYQVAVIYDRSRLRAVLADQIFLLIRYAVHGSRVLWSPGTGAWSAVDVTGLVAGQQLFAEVDRLGIYVIVAPQ